MSDPEPEYWEEYNNHSIFVLEDLGHLGDDDHESEAWWCPDGENILALVEADEKGYCLTNADLTVMSLLLAGF